MRFLILSVFLLVGSFHFTFAGDYVRQIQKLQDKKLPYKQREIEKEKIIDQALKKKVKDDGLYYYASTVYSYHDKYEQALSCINQAIALNPYTFAYYMQRASVFIDLKRYEDAMTDINTMFKMDPNIPEPYVEKGDYYFYRDSFSSALQWYAKAINVFESNHANSGWISYCYGQYGRLNIALGRADSAVSDFTKLLARFSNPIRPQIFMSRAMAFDKKGDLIGKARDLDSAFALKPDSVYLPYLYALKGDTEKVNTLIDIASKTQKMYPYDLARCYSELGETQKAVDNLEKFIQKDYYGLGWIQIDYSFHKINQTPEFAALIEKYRKKE